LTNKQYKFITLKARHLLAVSCRWWHPVANGNHFEEGNSGYWKSTT